MTVTGPDMVARYQALLEKSGKDASSPTATAKVNSEWKNALWENIVLLIPGDKTGVAADDPNKDATVILSAYYDSNSVVPALAPEFYRRFPAGLQILQHSGITAGSVSAIALHALLGPRRAVAEPVA